MNRVVFVGLWILISILTMSGVLAAVDNFTINAHGDASWVADVSQVAYKIGVKFIANTSSLLVNATAEATIEDTHWYLFQSDCSSSLKSGVLVGLVAEIDYNITGGTEYCLTLDKDGGARDFGPKTNAGDLFPYENPYLNWTARVYSDTTSDTVQLLKWESITTGIETPPPAPNVTAPTFVNPTPADNAHNLTQVTINATCDTGNTTFIWFDNFTPPTNQVVNGISNAEWTTNATDDNHYYYVAGCFDAAIGYSNNVSRDWYYDTTSPAITLQDTNEFNANNYSMLNQYDDFFKFNFTLTDNIALYGILINITRGGVSYYNETNTSLSGTSWDVEKSLSTTAWETGIYNIQIIASDSHTQNEIDDYVVSKDSSGGKSKLFFKTPNDNNIKIEVNEESSFGAVKDKDRYIFEFNFTNGLTQDRLFHVKTDKYKLNYIEDSAFKAHFVSGGGIGGNWIDFEGVSGEPTVTRLDDYHYTVFFENTPPKIRFRSIGGLNVNEQNFTWYRGSYIDQIDNAVSNEPTNYIFNITVNYDTQQQILVSLNYNNTDYDTTENNGTGRNYYNVTITTPNASADIDYTWTINITQRDDNLSNFTVTANQTVRFFGFDSCTVGNVVALNFSIYDENYPHLYRIANSFEYVITSYQSDPTNTQINYDNLTGQTNYSICILPAWTTLVINGYFKYTTSTGYTHRYYLVNHSVDNVTDQISIYNWNNTDASDLSLITRKNDDFSYFTNLYAKLQRYYIGENLWRTVQMDRSSEYGLLFFNIIEENTDYKIIYQDIDGNIVKTTDSSKFVCTLGICEITQLLDPYSSTTTPLVPSVNISYQNDTKLILATWIMSDGSNVNPLFQVYHTTGKNMTLICNTTQAGSGGTFTCNMTGYEGTAYVVLDLPGYSNVFSTLIQLASIRLVDFVSQGDMVFFLIALIMTIALSSVFHPVAVIMTTVLGVVLVGFLGFNLAIGGTLLILFGVLGVITSVVINK